MRIHVQPSASTGACHPLRRLFELSAPRLHRWTDDPSDADVIFLTARSPNVHSYDPVSPTHDPRKCVTLSAGWEPPFHLETFAARANPDRVNPLIEAHDSATNVARRPDLLASFLDGRHPQPLHDRLFALPKDRRLRIEDRAHIDPHRRLYEVSLRSKFMLCPRGSSAHPARVFEAMKLGISPVIISDDWRPSPGPRWAEFAIFVAEKDVDHLPAILAGVESTHWLRGELAHEAYCAFFAPTTYFNHLVASAASRRGARVGPTRLRPSFPRFSPTQRAPGLHRASLLRTS